MNGKDMFLGMNHVHARFVEEAETVTQLQGSQKLVSLRRPVLIVAIIALLAITVTACAYAIQRIRIDLKQHAVPVQTEMVSTDAEPTIDKNTVNVLTDYYPQTIPAGYEILCGSPLNHTSRNIQYCSAGGNSIYFRISTTPSEESAALRPPVEESTVTLSSGEALLQKNDGAQVLEWHSTEDGYYASLFTDDTEADLVSMADSVSCGKSIPQSVWYHRGQEWDPWYPQKLPQGYVCTEVAPVSNAYQSITFRNGSASIRFGISTREMLVPTEISEEARWEETEVNGVEAKLLRNRSSQRTLFWENQQEGFWAFLETMDETIRLEALAESVSPGEKLEVSQSYLGPDFTIELEQEPDIYMQWQSIYPQQIPDGYELKTVGDRAYGQQTILWENAKGETISYTLYFRLGRYGRSFEGSGQPETVSIHGHTGFRTGNSLLWADEELGFAYDLKVPQNVDLIALAESVDYGPELEFTDDATPKALEQLGDYRPMALPENMVEDGLSGSPMEDGGGWYSYVRRWYYDKTNNDQIYFTYESYQADCSSKEDVLRMLVSGMTEPKFVTVNGYPGIALQDGDRASVAWIMGDAVKGTSFQLYSEQFTTEELLRIAESIQKQ
ncbi:MAG: DUF4367 domain-containing protein [Oscillospiraceae bacterium]|nr:DUF4367 domain-containing protein [Oscillospiraceae bacterium]